ncbi:class I SAM-dependent methyltransferase [Neobacillus sp. SM06]|uniref:class I SAM-dependent methyltransferase n=1 Tax=Neobacillus sp. SM06 TaxID=3422492 RepID=UPI003D29192E
MAQFDDSAATYDSWCLTEIGSFVDHLEKEIVFQLAMPQMGEKALDLGCGTGIYSIWLARNGLNVTGVDLSANMLDRAKEKAASLSLPIAFVRSDIQQLPFEDETFDLVVANIVLEFVGNPNKVLQEGLRVLKKGGRFVCGFIGKDSPWGKKYQTQGQEKPGSVFANAAFFSPTTVSETLLPPDIIQLGLFFTADEFITKDQAMALEIERAKRPKENEAGYFGVCWNKNEGNGSEVGENLSRL